MISSRKPVPILRGHALWLQRAPHHRTHQIAAVVGVRLMIFQRVDRLWAAASAAVRNGASPGDFSIERGFGLRTIRRGGLRTARTPTRASAIVRRAGDDVTSDAAWRNRRRGSAEFVEPEFRIFRKQRQPSFGEQFIFGQCGRHDAREKILRCNHASRHACSLLRCGIKGRRDQTPFEAGSACARLPQKRARACGSDNALICAHDTLTIGQAGYRPPTCEMPSGARVHRSSAFSRYSSRYRARRPR